MLGEGRFLGKQSDEGRSFLRGEEGGVRLIR
jgi:hypothetical protein